MKVTYNKMFDYGEQVSALELINLSRDFLDVFSMVEAYCPPDDSDSWSDNASEMIQDMNTTEEQLKDLLQQANKYGIQLDF